MKQIILLALALSICGCGMSKEEQYAQKVLFLNLHAKLDEAARNDKENASIKAQTTKVATDCIGWVKTGKEELSKHIAYPLYRRYPIPPIRNEVEFLKRYDEVFDAELVKMITESDPEKDCSEWDWRGFDLCNCWIMDGMIYHIGYESPAEKRLREQLILADKARLHPSLKEFEEPIGVMETSNYKVRIDDLGYDVYRYAQWKAGSSMSTKPDLVLNGIESVEGSMRNVTYKFMNGDLRYECYIGTYFVYNGDQPTLVVRENADINDVFSGTEVLREDAKTYNYDTFN